MPRTRSHTDITESSVESNNNNMAAANESPSASRAPFVDGSAPSSSSPSIVMTEQQLLRLVQLLQMQSPAPAATCASPSPALSQGNFAKCTARFDGAKESDVVAFIDAIEVYKECVSMEDSIALRGLPMLFTGLAATWWQGVKASIESWSNAMDLLKQTYGPRLPPHRIYREIFSKEQGDETTDMFVCRVRALIAQLPPGSLKEDVQLVMVYGLLSTRIREKIPLSGFKLYAELLSQARRLEDLFEEGRPRQRKTDAGDGLSPAIPQKSASPSISTVKTKSRLLCGYCKRYGHEKADCSRLRERNQTKATDGTSSPPSVSSLVCFGCGAPGVIRANCTTCRASSTSSAMPFQAVAAVSATCQPRSRPVMRVGMYGEYARLLVDTGAKQSIASDSLRNFLCKNNHVFHKVHYDFKFANGVTNSDIVETALVDVTVQGVVVPTQFVVLPGATESLLGINFVRDAGMVLDFRRDIWSLRDKPGSFPLEYENVGTRIVCSMVDLLREDEATRLTVEERVQLSNDLDNNRDIFEPGGAATSFAVHRIDTGDHPPISVPPYRVTPAKKNILKKEIDKMLQEGIIEEADSEWTSPVVLVPKKDGTVRFCVDYRKLNHITRADKYPLPLIDELIQSTKCNSVMSTIDLKSGYWQIEVAPEDRDKTAFVSPFGTFRFRRMPFGLRHAPSTFQRLIDRFRSGLKDMTVVCYLDLDFDHIR
ncbi:hypothetical protein O3G_MSEX013500 [Manduca sexta]|uniref:Reverse transcriptase n=1 Tax=Manduca sexta TaxID=7130 RepID=A0A921ZRC8_MANSE|nr:hypothetical protein O3G_MSEX013500 [Manduca sexta]